MATSIRIVICEWNVTRAEALWNELRLSGHEPLVAFSIERAATQIATDIPGAVLLSSRMPDASYLSFIKDLRARSATSGMPVIVLGEEGETEDDCVGALEAGADDYIRRPYGVRELLARLQTLLRPVPRMQVPRCVSFETLTMDFETRRAFVRTDDGAEGVEVELWPTAFRFLRLLIENPNVVLSRKAIIQNVWLGANVKEGVIDVYLLALRKALKPVEQRVVIETVRGVGFRLTTTQAMLSRHREVTAQFRQGQPNPRYGSARKSAQQSPQRRTTQANTRAQQAYDEPVVVSDLGAALETIQKLRRVLIKTGEENRLLRDEIAKRSQTASADDKSAAVDPEA
jgi:two-component system, OmpR family, phosphate regulon response regulator PhoB